MVICSKFNIRRTGSSKDRKAEAADEAEWQRSRNSIATGFLREDDIARRITAFFLFHR